MARFVYADSPGGLGGQERALDSARDNRFFQSLAAQNIRQQMAEAEQQRELENQFKLMSFIASQKQNQLSNRFSLENRDYDRGQSAVKMLFERKKLADELASKERIAGLSVAARDRTPEQDYAEGYQMVDQGMPPTEAAKLFRFAPQQLARLTAHYGNKARMEEEELAPIEDTARFNQTFIQGLIDSARRGKAEQAALSRFTPFTRDATLKADVAKLPVDKLPPLDEPTFNNLVQSFIMKQKLESLLRPDPAGQRVQTIPQRRRFQMAPVAPDAAVPAAGMAPPTAPPWALRQAEEAIRLGADPAKVFERLQSLGAGR